MPNNNEINSTIAAPIPLNQNIETKIELQNNKDNVDSKKDYMTEQNYSDKVYFKPSREYDPSIKFNNFSKLDNLLGCDPAFIKIFSDHMEGLRQIEMQKQKDSNQDQKEEEEENDKNFFEGCFDSLRKKPKKPKKPQ